MNLVDDLVEVHNPVILVFLQQELAIPDVNVCRNITSHNVYVYRKVRRNTHSRGVKAGAVNLVSSESVIGTINDFPIGFPISNIISLSL